MTLPVRLRPRWRRGPWRSVEERGPVVVGVLAVGVLVAAFWTFSVEAPGSGVIARLYSSLDLFAGNYLPLEGQGDVPSPAFAVLGLVALVLTFTAAVTAVLSLTARARERFRARHAGHELVVLGTGKAAAEILRSQEPSSVHGLLLVTDDSRGPAGVSARGRAPTLVADLDALTDEHASWVRGRGGRVAVATDDDALNLELAQRLAIPEVPGRAVLAIVGHPFLVEELRPPVISGRLPMSFSISCPVEKVAEQVCHQLDRLLSEEPHLRAAGRGTVVVEGDGGETARTVETWVRRFTWSRSFLHGGDGGRIPLLRMEDEWEADPGGPVIRVFVGNDPADTAARTLRGLRRRQEGDRGFVAVTSPQLLPPVHAPHVGVVDSRSAAWDPEVLFDDIEAQWGRLYHSIYGLLFGNVTDWSDVSSSREGQSSVAASRFMLRNLEAHGYHLVKTEQPPSAADFTPAEVTSLAIAEHEEWLRHRTYVDERGERVSAARAGSSYRVPWDQLDEEKQRDNRELIACTVPALAALFGYEVRRVPADLDVGVSAAAGAAPA